MTDAINYIQSLFSFSNVFAPAKAVAAHDTKLVKSLIKDAKSLTAVAETEAEHGATARSLMQTAATGNETLADNMKTIAVWHFERSLRKYEDAAARYSEAGRVQTKNSRIFFAEARSMAERADETVRIIKALEANHGSDPENAREKISSGFNG